MILADQTMLERVRLRRARLDAPVARLRLSHALSSASLKPRAMPPSAILIVRTMADPMPGKVTKKLAPAALATVEWERAAQDSLADFYRNAVRPLREIPSSNARSVLFADYGEMLACLARDLSCGAPLGWWWRSILQRLSTRLPGSWAAAWLEHPSFIPAALEYLQESDQAVQVLERIAPLQAWRLLKAVFDAFELMALSELGDSGARDSTEAGRAAVTPFREHNAGISQDGLLSAPISELAPFPWEPHVPRSAVPAQLGYQRQALLGMSLLLRRAPQAALRGEFPLIFRAWLESVERRGRHRADSEAMSSVSATEPSTHLTVPEERRRHQNENPQNSSQTEFSSLTPDGPTSPKKPNTPAKAVSFIPSTSTEPSPARETAAVLQSFSDPAPREWKDGESTRAAGVFYLIHFLRQAELLHRFDTGLGGWALIELLARCLLDKSADLSGDPVWAALAILDGRNPGEPPAGFHAQHIYEAPSSWTANVSPSRSARFRSRGLELWTEEGFLVLDSPEFTIPPGVRSFRRKFRVRVRPLALSISPELRRFLHFVLPYARWRIGRALGGARLEDLLLRQGKLYLTRTHVDLVMSMREISVPVRMAGMDANPGWVPELSRVITFHFSQEGM